MIKVKTVGMVNDNKKSFPTVKAHADIINGYFCTIAGDATVAPTATTVKSKELHVVINTFNGDDSYSDGIVKIGEYANCFLLREWANMYFQITEDHITYASGDDYDDLSKNDKLVVNTSGKLEVASDVSDYAIYFVITDKIRFAGSAIEAQLFFRNLEANIDQVAPTGLVGVAPTTVGGSDGKITGTTAAMEYKTAAGADSTYADCSDVETTTLSAGDYVVRYKARTNYNASPTTAITVPAGA